MTPHTEQSGMRPAWHGETGPGDWLFDGSPIRGAVMLGRWERLQWGRAVLDMGPSPAGNLGPYWKVPLDFEGEELWARLYPKLLATKWLPVVRHAIEQSGMNGEAR